jgi:hypothetical protein
MWKGIVTEVSFPTIDRPQLRDVQYLITDGRSFFHEEKRHLEVWTFNRRVRFMRSGEMLRVIGAGRFRLRWSSDDWASAHDSPSQANALNIDYVDLAQVTTTSGMVIEFTFFWLDANRWEGQNYAVTVRA